MCWSLFNDVLVLPLNVLSSLTQYVGIIKFTGWIENKRPLYSELTVFKAWTNIARCIAAKFYLQPKDASLVAGPMDTMRNKIKSVWCMSHVLGRSSEQSASIQ